MHIIAWSHVVPWPELRQVEQDLVISRALVVLFTDPFLHEQLRFRGGTALNKLHFPRPYRYSEDIDLVRTSAGPIGPILNGVRETLEPWLGRARFQQSDVSPTMTFRAPAEDPGATAQLRLKIEINTREIDAIDAPRTVPLHVDNPWFSGNADVATFSPEELLATKLRALLQRDKGRDLFDLAHALDVIEHLDTRRVVECFAVYVEKTGERITRAQAEQRMFDKLRRKRLLADVKPLLAADAAALLTDESATGAFIRVFAGLIRLLPGDPWARSEEMIERFELPELIEQ